MKYLLVFLCICYSVLILLIDNVSPSMDLLVFYGWIGLIQFIISIYSWVKRGNQLISPYIIFLVCLYIFSYGQCLIYPFGMDLIGKSLIGYLDITMNSMYKGQLYTLLMLAAFHLGALICVDKKLKKLENRIIKKDFNKRRIQTIGWIVFVISVGPYYTDLINQMAMSLIYGYGALYEGVDKIGIETLATYIGYLFIPSVICLLVAYKDSVKIRILLEGILVCNVLMILVTGGRSNAVIIIGLLLIVHNFLVKKITKKGMIIVGCGAIILLIALSIVGKMRTESGRALSVYSIGDSSNGVINSIAEMGGSMSCLIKTQDYVPQREDFKYGRTYAFAFTTLIPNLGFWKIHPAKVESNNSEWLTDLMGLTYGTGFSMCAEAYRNFGYLSWAVMLIFGYLFAWGFGYMEIAAKNNNAPLLIAILIMFYSILGMPRSDFIGIIRPFFFYTLPLYFLCKTRNSNLRNKNYDSYEGKNI